MKRVLFSIITHEFFIFLSCIGVLYGVTYSAISQNYRSTPPDKYYVGAEEYPIDVIGDFSYIQQGYNGHWKSFVNQSSTVPDRASVLKMEYLVPGHIARILHIYPVDMFFLTRNVISLLYLFTIYFICIRVFRKKHERVIAIILSIFSASLTLPTAAYTITKIAVTDVGVFQRLTVVPYHYMLGGLSTLLSLYYLAIALDYVQNRKAFFFAVLFGFIASWVYTPDVFIVFSSFPFFVLIKAGGLAIEHKSVKKLVGIIGALFAYSVIVALPILYILMRLLLFTKQIPGNDMEKLNPFTLNTVNYIFALGVPYFLSIIAVWSILRKRSTLLLLFACWVITHPLGEYIISPLVNINKIRYFLTPYFVIFGIVGTVGIIFIANACKKIHHLLYWVVVVVLVFVTIGSGYWAYQDSRQGLGVCFCNPWFDFGYPKKDMIIAMNWLHTHTTENDIVFSDTTAGILIPAFAGNRVFTSWWYRLTDASQYYWIMARLYEFYGGKMSNFEAKNFLEQSGIAYVFYSEQERADRPGGGELTYPFLEEVERVGQAVIYKVH